MDISKRVEKAIAEITTANTTELSYDNLKKVITKTSKKWDVTEKFLRTIGGWNLKSKDFVIALWNEAKAIAKTGDYIAEDKVWVKFNYKLKKLSDDDSKAVKKLFNLS